MEPLTTSVTIREERCKGCGLCDAFCPVGAMALRDDLVNASGYRPAYQRAGIECSGCGHCSLMCPDCAVTIHRTRTSHGHSAAKGSENPVLRR